MRSTIKHPLTLFADPTSGLLLPLLAADTVPQPPGSSAATPYPGAKFSIEHAMINQVYPQWSPKTGYNRDSDMALGRVHARAASGEVF